MCKKFIASSLTLFIIMQLICGCNKDNQNSDFRLVGTHSFSGPCKYVFDGFAGSQPAAMDSSEMLQLAISRPDSKDSSDYILIPLVFQHEPLGGEYLKMSTVAGDDINKVAIKITDTLLTIPGQFLVSGMGITIDGSGSIVNGKITIRYHTLYRAYNKYSTIVSN